MSKQSVNVQYSFRTAPNYLKNNIVQNMDNSSYIQFDRMLNGASDDINLNNCNFMVVAKGPLTNSFDAGYTLSFHPMIPVYKESCVQVVNIEVQESNEYVYNLKFAIMRNFSEALNNRSSEEFKEVESFVTRYVNIYL